MAIYRRPKQMKLRENLYAQPGEFFYDDGKPFEGYYHMFDTRKKKFFEGPIYEYKAREIFPEQRLEFSVEKNREYTNIWREIGDKTLEIKMINEPENFTPQPSAKDIEKGELTRYLLLQSNSRRVYEIDENQFKAYGKGSNPYNSNYKVAKISWFITGPLFSIYGPGQIEIKQGIYERNIKQAEIVLEDIPELFPLVQDLLQYTAPDTDENLYSDGTKLFLPNGKKYVGKYHIHPGKGPMVGSKHGQYPHAVLKALL